MNLPQISNEAIEWEYKGWRFGGWLSEHSEVDIPDKIVIAFHGFDRNAKEMLNFRPLINDRTAILSISLLHHNKSVPLPPIPLDEALEPIILIEGIEWFIAQRFSNNKEIKLELLGYSMGSSK